MWDGVSLKTPRPRGWVRAGRPSGGKSSFNKRTNVPISPCQSTVHTTSVAKPGIPGAIKIGWVCTADYRMLLGTAVRPVPARMPYISRLCDVGATDVKRWWWWWWWYEQKGLQSSSSSSFILKTSLFHAKLGLDVCPKSSPSTHP